MRKVFRHLLRNITETITIGLNGLGLVLLSILGTCVAMVLSLFNTAELSIKDSARYIMRERVYGTGTNT